MTDFAIQPTQDGNALDIVVFNGDAVRDDSLRIACQASLFSDAEASAEQLAQFGLEPADRRGYWADGLATDGDRFGSLLWLLARSLETAETARHAKDFAERALAWMLADGVVSRVTVTSSWVGRGFLQLVVELVAPSGVFKLRYALVWANAFIDPLAESNSIAARTARTAAEFDFIYYVQYPGVSQP